MNPVIDTHGTKRWLRNGNLHRTDGPAVIYTSGEEWWYQNGKIHREDGPAISYANKYYRWYVNGCPCYSINELRMHSRLSNEEILLLILKYGEIK